jgi:hypothetical protein
MMAGLRTLSTEMTGQSHQGDAERRAGSLAMLAIKYFCKRTTGERLPGLTPDMPGVVLALAFTTRQTQGGGVVQGLRVGCSARVRRESAQ